MRYKWLSLCLSAVMLAGACSGCGKDKAGVMNYTAPEEGEEIVVMTIAGYGDVKIRLFSDLMPKAAENFLTLAKEGYYDGLIFHRVIENFMIQGGDPTGTGRGGESCWGGKFDGGTCEELIHLPGALAYANSGSTATDGSQFYIVTGSAVTDESLDYYESPEFIQKAGLSYTPSFTDQERELYKQYGGAPHLDGGYTVFGQVIDGLDIIYAISRVETEQEDPSSANRPLEDVVIEQMTVVEYDGSAIRWYPSDYDMSE